MAQLTQPGLLQTIAYLMGERTVNATTSTSRADFLQKTLVEAYGAFPWRWAKTSATLSISNTIATLPTDFDNTHPVHVWYNAAANSPYTLTEIDPADSDKVANGDLTYWIDANSDGSLVLKTKDTASTALIVDYQKVPPTLDTAGTVGTPYPNPMTLALGARRFVKLGQNPDADISQDQALFEKFLNKDIAGEQVPHARKRRATRQYLTGRSTGDF